jgi:hypothetical protein
MARIIVPATLAGVVACCVVLHIQRARVARATKHMSNAVNDSTGGMPPAHTGVHEVVNTEEEGYLKLLQSEDSKERHMALIYFGERKSKRAFPHLIRALDDEVPSIRGRAAWALGEIGDRAAVRPIVTALKRSCKETMDDPLARDDFLVAMFVALETLTGERFGYDLEKWEAYVRENKDKLP